MGALLYKLGSLIFGYLVLIKSAAKLTQWHTYFSILTPFECFILVGVFFYRPYLLQPQFKIQKMINFFIQKIT